MVLRKMMLKTEDPPEDVYDDIDNSGQRYVRTVGLVASVFVLLLFTSKPPRHIIKSNNNLTIHLSLNKQTQLQQQ